MENFCPSCGSILPLRKIEGYLQCICCRTQVPCEVLHGKSAVYTVYFNTVESEEALKPRAPEKESDGPLVDRTCPKCQNPVMSYATLQLRSADEGQTVFYTCPKCKHREFETT